MNQKRQVFTPEADHAGLVRDNKVSMEAADIDGTAIVALSTFTRHLKYIKNLLWLFEGSQVVDCTPGDGSVAWIGRSP